MDPAELASIDVIAVRLAIAMVMGLVLGIDRDLHHKPAGLRVLALVCVGACAITMASIRSFAAYNPLPNNGILPTIQGILSGIGFLGAGVILRTQGRDEVHGVTTAAAIWISAILGMTCGLGQIVLSVATFGFAWCIMVIGRFLEIKLLDWMPPSEPAVSRSPSSENPR